MTKPKTMWEIKKIIKNIGEFREEEITKKNDKVYNKNINNKSESDFSKEKNKAILFITNLSQTKREKLLALLIKIQKIQKSKLNTSEKAIEIKKIMWTNQSPGSKLLIGGLIGTIGGIFIFGTGGLGIVGLGGAIGVWGGLAGTAGGVLVSSIIQNFEKQP